MSSPAMTTVNLWDTLCAELVSRREQASAAEHAEVARAFVDSAKSVLRADTPRLADAYEIAGDLCEAASIDEQAAEHYRQAYDLSSRHHWFISAGRAAAKWGFVLESLGKNDLAARSLQKALTAFDDAGDHSQHVAILTRLAAIYRKSGEMPRSISAFERAIQISIRMHGRDHPEVADVMNNFAVAQTQVGDLDLAENLNLSALAIRESSFGPNHPEVAQSMGNLAVIYHLRGDTSRASNYYQGALEICKYCGDTGDNYLLIKKNFDRLKSDLNPTPYDQ
ncbi:MAG: tetratricopeptide repeat protein [Chthoniobacterales bacterium]